MTSAFPSRPARHFLQHIMRLIALTLAFALLAAFSFDAEAARLGFSSAIVPAQGSEDLSGVDGITVFTVSDLATAIRVSFPADSQ